jgi:hypothetical protein
VTERLRKEMAAAQPATGGLLSRCLICGFAHDRDLQEVHLRQDGLHR